MINRMLCAVLVALSFTYAVVAGEKQENLKELLQAEVLLEQGETLVFSLKATDKTELEGGVITLGDQDFEIEKVSAHNLIGSHYANDNEHRYMVFSSSYSSQTATGVPWVKAQVQSNCDQPYNSFLAVYSINDTKKLDNLAPVPFGELVESLSLSDTSFVSCFMAWPPEKAPKT